ncbi:hypothetical protein [Legionella sp. km772]|uniref:hypothetical protein n=1 Tax=Legionella sp. km772 TaxID=2498111 RepID=UPI000F8F578A|nr:hypothetical protein [Legionella sp. km772]RUR14243.1 hypothetical protein ELY15_00325 [Legionella sp. km772]
MKEKISWYEWFSASLKEFVVEAAKPYYEIVDIFECDKTGFTKAAIKYSGRHIKEKNISDIVMDNELIKHLDPKTIRTLTYIAAVERLKPDYSILVHHMTSEVDEYLLEIKSRHSKETLKKSPTELSKDKEIISKFNPIDANKIGYMAGVRETVKEYEIKKDL